MRQTQTSGEQVVPRPGCTLRRYRMVLLATLLLGAIRSAAQEPTRAPPTTLRGLAQARGFLVGAAVRPQPLASDTHYRQTLAREFNMLATEGAMKFAPLRPTRERFDWRHADSIVNFAQTNSLRVRGHTLVWHRRLPAWFSDTARSRDEVIAILRDHISTVVERYRGRVAAWDVVNEAIDARGNLRETVFLRTLGPEYIDLAFRVAHDADPGALLFYNDSRAEALGPKSDAVFALVRDLRRRGIPIHGVGMQMHLRLDSLPDLEGMAANIRRLGTLGLEVHVTEMDVRIREPVTEEKLRAQARVYRDVARVCLAAPNCTALVMWGFTDRYSWIPRFRPGYGAALIFDTAYRAKPAYAALAAALAGR